MHQLYEITKSHRLPPTSDFYMDSSLSNTVHWRPAGGFLFCYDVIVIEKELDTLLPILYFLIIAEAYKKNNNFAMTKL